MLILSVDFSGPEAQVSIQVSHYGILEGLQLTQYLVTQSLVLFNILIMLVDVAHAVSREVRSSKYDVTKLIEPFVDFMCAALVIIYVILMFRSVPGSASSAAKVLQGLEGIPWSNPDVRLQVKSCVRSAHDSLHDSATKNTLDALKTTAYASRSNLGNDLNECCARLDLLYASYVIKNPLRPHNMCANKPCRIKHKSSSKRCEI